ncbi:MAG: hypothetical protein ACLU4N_00545 [Butyricimonas faecihominis]
MKKENHVEGGFYFEFVLRASYGVTGTQGFAPYQSRELYSYGALLILISLLTELGGTVAMPNEN